MFDAEAGRAKVSHPELAELASFLEGDRRDYDRHEGVFLEDLGSSNGTFVRVQGTALVPRGALLLMGQQLFRVEY